MNDSLGLIFSESYNLHLLIGSVTKSHCHGFLERFDVFLIETGH